MHLFSRQRTGSLACAMASSGRRFSSGQASAQDHVRARRQRGFTLIELLITLSVAAVLIAIAIPNFRILILNNRLTTAANDVVVSINLARIEAIKRNASVQLCSNDATSNGSSVIGTVCSGTTGGAGAIVATYGTSSQVVQGPVASITTPLQLHGNMVALVFNSQGIAQQVGGTTPFSSTATTPVIDICTTQLTTNNHRQIMMVGGTSVTVTTPTTSGSCP